MRILLGFTFAVGVLFAVTPEEANQLFQAQNWGKAAEAYQALAAADPSTGFYSFRAGVAFQSAKQSDAALRSYEEARQRKHLPPALFIRAAITCVQLNQKESAIKWIEGLFETGGAPPMLAGIATLEPLLKDPRYTALATKYTNRCERPEYHALDFWIGEWDVTGVGGATAGTNRIEKAFGGCGLQENWTSAGGGEGRSFTWFDGQMGKWRQVYLGTGYLHNYVGEQVGKSVRFVHDEKNPDGARQMLRMTFTPQDNGDVRQFIEESWDGGKNWTVWFDGMYKRKK